MNHERNRNENREKTGVSWEGMVFGKETREIPSKVVFGTHDSGKGRLRFGSVSVSRLVLVPGPVTQN